VPVLLGPKIGAETVSHQDAPVAGADVAAASGGGGGGGGMADLGGGLGAAPGLLGSAVRPCTYDGDTPHAERAARRRDCNVFFTNPDMLHGAILPGVHHGRPAQLTRAPAPLN
jgi:hypothetical protein